MNHSIHTRLGITPDCQENRKKLQAGVLCAGHGLSDLNQSALSALLPFIIADTSLTLAEVSLIVMISNLAGSLCQPVFGWLADKKSSPVLLSISILAACGGISMMGFSDQLSWLCFSGAVSGIGVALFHPQAALMLSRLGNKNRQSRLMSWFSLGGKAGFSIGPLMAAACMNIGRQGLLLFMIPALIYGLAVRKIMRNLTAPTGESVKKPGARTGKKDQWLLFGGLCVIIFGRSIITNAVSTFTSPLLISEYSLSADTGSLFLSVSYAAGAAAVLAGGVLADRFGESSLLMCTLILMSFGLGLSILNDNLILTMTGLLILAAGESLCYSPLIVLSQRLLPNHQGLASGISLGLAVSIGALFVPSFGLAADQSSVRIVFVILTAISVCMIPVMFFLKSAIRRLNRLG